MNERTLKYMKGQIDKNKTYIKQYLANVYLTRSLQ